MKRIAFYVTGHGLGHLSRSILIIKALLRKAPGLKIFIRSTAPESFARDRLGTRMAFKTVDSGMGAFQLDTLHLSEKKTLEKFARFYKARESFYGPESRFLSREKIDLVMTDFSPFSFPLAWRCGLPSAGIANFTWDWIYEDYIRDFPKFRWCLAAIREMHAMCNLMLRAPFHHPFKGFSRVDDIPLTAQLSIRAKSEIRRKLGLPLRKRLILPALGDTKLPPHPGLISSARARFCDLVKAADVVLTKPGYGIVADCLANGTGVIYTSRGRFREYRVLARVVKQRLNGVFITNRRLAAGTWGPSLGKFFAIRRPIAPVVANGAAAAAGKILALLGRGA